MLSHGESDLAWENRMRQSLSHPRTAKRLNGSWHNPLPRMDTFGELA